MAGPHLSVITLATKQRDASRKFYEKGFGWSPVFENEKIVFYPLNGMILALFDWELLEKDSGGAKMHEGGAITLSHNVASQREVDRVIDELAEAGGTISRRADEPPHGGYRGYVRDPDGHAWEIAFMDKLIPDSDGNVVFDPN